MKASFTLNEFNDIDHYMEFSAPFIDIRSIQIKPGTMFIKDHLLEIDGLVIDYYCPSLNLVDHYSIPPKQILFSLTPVTNVGCKWCGIDVPTNSIGVQHFQREHHALMPANWDTFGIMMNEELAMQESLLSEGMRKQTQQPEKAIFNQSLRIKPLRTKLSRFFQTPGLLNALIKNESAKIEFKNWVLNELRLTFIEIEDFQNSRSTRVLNLSKRYKMHAKAIAVIEENLTTPLSIMQICDKIGTTPRTLQLCFKELTGISPVQYIKARKLHAIQQEIFLLKNSTKPISHIVQDYGIQHAGRFSAEYKQMFLELPRETLKRREIR